MIGTQIRVLIKKHYIRDSLGFGNLMELSYLRRPRERGKREKCFALMPGRFLKKKKKKSVLLLVFLDCFEKTRIVLSTSIPSINPSSCVCVKVEGSSLLAVPESSRNLHNSQGARRERGQIVGSLFIRGDVGIAINVRYIDFNLIFLTC